MRNRRLHADANQTVGVIHRFPCVDGKFATAIIGVAVVPNIDFRAVIHQNLDDVGPPFMRGAVERRTPGVGLSVRVEPEIEQHLHGFERAFGDHS